MGYDKKRDTDTFFKRYTAEAFYKLLNKMDVEAVYNYQTIVCYSARAQ